MKSGLSVRVMMVVVLIVGVAAAAFRVHPALGVLVLSVLSLATIRTSGAIDRHRTEGASVRPRDVVRIFAASTLVASTILAATGLTTILFGEILGRAFYNVDHPSALGNILLLIPSVLLAAPIIVRLRRRLW